MTTLDRAVRDFYKDGKMTEEGFMILTDMREALLKQEPKWNRTAAIEYVINDHSISRERATDLIDWAIDKLVA